MLSSGWSSDVCSADLEAPADKVCLLGCGVTTGIGAVHNTAKVQGGDSVAVFGLGALGLAVIQGAVQAKAGRIIAIDTNPAKFDKARAMGATECVNPKDHCTPDGIRPIQQVVVEMTGWGVDPSFECLGTGENRTNKRRTSSPQCAMS